MNEPRISLGFLEHDTFLLEPEYRLFLYLHVVMKIQDSHNLIDKTVTSRHMHYHSEDEIIIIYVLYFQWKMLMLISFCENTYIKLNFVEPHDLTGLWPLNRDKRSLPEVTLWRIPMCTNCNSTQEKSLKFIFYFPKDPIRAVIWQETSLQ